jgi:hypothetical protein
MEMSRDGGMCDDIGVSIFRCSFKYHSMLLLNIRGSGSVSHLDVCDGVLME